MLFLQVCCFFILIKVKMKVRELISIIVLYFISYLIFIFPFDVLSSWLGKPTSIFEAIISTTIVFSLCLYYFRSKSTNKIIKFFVYEGFGIGTVSFFLILPFIVVEYFNIIRNILIQYNRITYSTTQYKPTHAIQYKYNCKYK